MRKQVEIADDLRLQEADRVCGGRVAESGREFLSHAGTADDVAPLEYLHLEPGHAEVGGAHEAVVTAADDDHVILGHHAAASNLALSSPAQAGDPVITGAGKRDKLFARPLVTGCAAFAGHAMERTEEMISILKVNFRS